MSVLEFILGMTEALAWPIVALVIVIWFRKQIVLQLEQIADLLKRSKKATGKFAGAEVSIVTVQADPNIEVIEDEG